MLVRGPQIVVHLNGWVKGPAFKPHEQQSGPNRLTGAMSVS